MWLAIVPMPMYKTHLLKAKLKKGFGEFRKMETFGLAYVIEMLDIFTFSWNCRKNYC